jgi:hypothetical protein
MQPTVENIFTLEILEGIHRTFVVACVEVVFKEKVTRIATFES